MKNFHRIQKNRLHGLSKSIYHTIREEHAGFFVDPALRKRQEQLNTNAILLLSNI